MSGRLPDPGPAAICARCDQPRGAHGGPKRLGACPDQSGLYARRFQLRDEDKPEPEPGLPERMRRRIRVGSNGCWNWTTRIDRDGYGRTTEGQKDLLAHRAVYARLVGPIDPGLTIDHLCRNRACVNPKHMEPVTQGVNYIRGHLARRRERGTL